MVRPTITGSTAWLISNAVIWVMVAVLGVNDAAIALPPLNLNCPLRLKTSSTSAKARLDVSRLIFLLPALRSMGSESTTVCTDSGQNLSYASAADRMTLSSASNASRLRNRLTFWIVDPTKLGSFAVMLSPATRPDQVNFWNVKVPSLLRINTCGMVAASNRYWMPGATVSCQTPWPKPEPALATNFT